MTAVRVIDLMNVIKENINYTYYPNAFPATAVDDVATVTMTGGGVPNKNIQFPSFQVLVRAKSPVVAEAKAQEIFDHFNIATNFNVGNSHVIFCEAQQSTPLYIGTDDNGRSIYSVNFNMITEAIN